MKTCFLVLPHVVWRWAGGTTLLHPQYGKESVVKHMLFSQNVNLEGTQASLGWPRVTHISLPKMSPMDTFNFFFGCAACWILVPRPGIKPTPPAVEARSLNHWTAREVPECIQFQTQWKCNSMAGSMWNTCEKTYIFYWIYKNVEIYEKINVSDIRDP